MSSLKNSEISLQLYSLRNELNDDFSSTMSRVRDLGYTNVELYNVVAWKDQLSVALDENGIKAPTAHARLTLGNRDEIFEAAVELGVQTIIDPLISAERWTEASSVREIADELSLISEEAKKYGLKFGYHNHSWEIENRIDGKPALEYLAEYLPADISFEVDAYWAAVAGADVPEMLTRLGERVKFLHVKDTQLAADGTLSKDRFDQVPIGEGVIDWRAVFSATSSIEMYVVEFDEYRGDVFEGIGRGLNALTNWRTKA